MINKELFEGPVGDYCIARNTIKCLLLLLLLCTSLLEQYHIDSVDNIPLLYSYTE